MWKWITDNFNIFHYKDLSICFWGGGVFLTNGAGAHFLGGTAVAWCLGVVSRVHDAIQLSSIISVGRLAAVGLLRRGPVGQLTAPHLIMAHLVILKHVSEVIEHGGLAIIRGQLGFTPLVVHLGAVHHAHGRGRGHRVGRHANLGLAGLLGVWFVGVLWRA